MADPSYAEIPSEAPPGHGGTTPAGFVPGELAGVLRDARHFFRAQVAASWVPRHLTRRNLSTQLDPAQIGYAPPGWTATLDYLRGRGHTEQAVEAAGLARRTPAGQLVDFFRDRLTVPLSNPTNQLVGFTARRPDSADAPTVPQAKLEAIPKYVNSPATTVFAKHAVLYGLGEDRHLLDHGWMPVLVEGPMDRLAVRCCDPHLAVSALAPCGTALTRDQVRSLLNAVGPLRPVAVALDPDPAGRAATLRAWELFTAAGHTNLVHITSPDGQDPAELVRNGRSAALREAVVHHRPLALAAADQRVAAAGPRPDEWAQRATILRHILDADLRFVPAGVTGRYLGHVARRLDLDPELASAVAAEVVTGGAGTQIQRSGARPPRSRSTAPRAFAEPDRPLRR